MYQLSFYENAGFRVQLGISESKLVGVKTRNFWYTSLRFFQMAALVPTISGLTSLGAAAQVEVTTSIGLPTLTTLITDTASDVSPED